MIQASYFNMIEQKLEHETYWKLIKNLSQTLREHNIAEIDYEKTGEIYREIQEKEQAARWVLSVLNWGVLEESLLHASNEAREHGGQSCISLFYDSSNNQAILTISPHPSINRTNPWSRKSPLELEVESFANSLSKGVKNYECVTGHRAK